ncbi:GNAT family N-acetyltransferase [Planococcus donghaensis]|uniref:GNAT family N-acetyltransferase n=1 Tax=Planococcus donghaensis TaxID=414778 RepID=A0A1C7EEP1_9BACL|nr:GNAT family N-acetyltransferase [Planococcus donghaensis]ANU22175.1 GNAT family N-acetyltransferase [Planococcus donghaensis]
MEISIRQALPGDAKKVAPLIINAIGKIANHMTAEKDSVTVREKVEDMVRGENTRHSYHYTYVATLAGDIVGILVLYHGNQAEVLDRYLMEQLKKQGHERIFEPEAHLDEWYIDTVSIDPPYQGQGIGSKLLDYAEELVSSSGNSKLSLNVDVDKEGAIRLYKRLGYSIAEPWMIIGEPFHHMVKIIS